MKTIAGFKLQEKLYRTAYREIYRSLRLSDQQSVILKLPFSEQPAPADIANLQHEYHLLKQLSLPGLIQAYDYVQQGYIPILVLEDINGISLKDYLRDHKLSLSTFFKIAIRLVEIVADIHRHHVIHKDINPTNIIIEPTSLLIKLIDFSISTRLKEEIQDYLPVNALEGTLAYIAPEQTGRMNRPIDYRSDYYSLGATFYEMLAGRLPFDTTDPLELVHCHIAKDPPPLHLVNTKIPERLAAIVAKLMAKMPENRYSSSMGLKEDLLECQNQWEQNQKIENFKLGKNDISDQLHISHQIYGREQQRLGLIKSFKRARQGKAELILIAGYSGIGKTSLVKEIHKPIVKQKGYFIQGKYDQLQRRNPYSAITEAFSKLILQILSESEENFINIKKSVLKALGANGQVIIDVIPELERLIGPQPKIPELNPSEAQNRFNYTFQNFVQVFAHVDHPLVIFLDDLQWADYGSLKLIETLLTNPDIKHFLFIGAYRDNEVDENHLLFQTIKFLQKNTVSIENLVLQPLRLIDIQNLLANTLHLTILNVLPLAEILLQKTGGNPFFICEFLRLLSQKQILRFSHEKKRWCWDIGAILELPVTENIMHLLEDKINLLSEDVKNVLKIAACLKHSFDLQAIANISEKSLPQLAQVLWAAVEIGLVVPVGHNYRFVENIRYEQERRVQQKVSYRFSHDRIQQVVYSLISEDDKEKLHLKMGYSLIKNQVLQADDPDLFDVVQHFNQARKLLNHPQQLIWLAEANLWAAQKAESSSAFQSACQYLQVGIELLAEDAWDSQYPLTFKLYKKLMECSYLTGAHTEAERYFQMLIEKVIDKYDKAEIYLIKISMCGALARYQDAVTVACTALNLFGINISPRPNKLEMLLTVLKIYRLSKNSNIKNLKLNKAENRDFIYISKIIYLATTYAYIFDQNLFVLLTSKHLTLTFKYGFTDYTCFALVSYALVLIAGFKKYHKAFDFIAIYERIKKQTKDVSSLLQAESAYYLLIHHWKFPAKSGIEHLWRNSQQALAIGNLAYTLYDYNGYRAMLDLTGHPLPELLRINQDLEHMRVKLKNEEYVGFIQTVSSVYQFMLNEKQNIENIDFYQSKLEIGDNSVEKISICYICMKYLYIMNDFERAIFFAEKGIKYISHLEGFFNSIEYKLFYILSIMVNYESLSWMKRKKYNKYILKCKRQFNLYANEYTKDLRPHYLLASAEIARIEGNITLAADLYDLAIKEACDLNFTHLVGIINECAARFYLKLNKPKFAKIYLQDAWYAFHNWGAVAKIKQLEENHPDFFSKEMKTNIIGSECSYTPTLLSSMNATHLIDMNAIVKSQQAISQELQLDKLLQKLLQILLAVAGAERCIIMVKQNNVWYVEAESDLQQQYIYLIENQSINERSDLPLKLIQFIQRKHEQVDIPDASKSELIQTDSYVKKTELKSILALPLIYQGQLNRILYFENNQSTYAFTTHHLQSLELLAAQAIISLENAQLFYQSTHDPLTGLANRSLLYQLFNQTINQIKNSKKSIAILFLDLDNFKKINDHLGHGIGDDLLKYFAHLLQNLCGKNDLAARLGGDEFVILLTELDQENSVIHFLNRFYQLIAFPALIQGYEINISSSTGISFYGKHGYHLDDLIKKADEALYMAKKKGKNQYQICIQN